MAIPNDTFKNHARRTRLDLMTESEKAIYNAMQEVEKVGAHPKLTEVTTMLSKAKDLLGDYLDDNGY